jgi:hypothetical protein
MTVARDSQTDMSRDGGGQIRREDVAYELDFRALTVAQENARNGYTMGDKPTGDGQPRRLDTAGSRGAVDSRS